jgi:hypothetical protein
MILIDISLISNMIIYLFDHPIGPQLRLGGLQRTAQLLRAGRGLARCLGCAGADAGCQWPRWQWRALGIQNPSKI